MMLRIQRERMEEAFPDTLKIIRGLRAARLDRRRRVRSYPGPMNRNARWKGLPTTARSAILDRVGWGGGADGVP